MAPMTFGSEEQSWGSVPCVVFAFHRELQYSRKRRSNFRALRLPIRPSKMTRRTVANDGGRDRTTRGAQGACTGGFILQLGIMSRTP